MNDFQTPLMEIPSPDNNYCVSLFALPTPEEEPLKLTFAIYKVVNGTKEMVFNLPETSYCVDGVDHIIWDRSSTAITYTVNQYKSIFIYDFIFQIKKEKPVPDNLVKCYWDKNIGNWILKSRSRIEEFRIYYSHNDIRDFFFFNWGNTQIELIKTPFKEHKDHPLFKVFFMNTDHDFRYAETTDSLFVYNPTLITIDENGQARIPVCDAYLTEYSCLICELSQFGQGDNFIVKKEDLSDSPISLPIKDLPSDQSPFYSIRQDCKGLGESGLTQYLDLEFIDKQTGKVHYSYPRRKDSKGEWNNDRTKFFFNGNEEMLDEDDVFYNNASSYDVFVVLDVKNKTCIKEYRGSALHPRWNAEGTDVIFDNKLEFREIFMAKEQEQKREEEERKKANAKHKEELQQKGMNETQQKVLYPLGHSIFIHELFGTKKQKVYPLGEPFYTLPSPDGLHSLYLKRRDRKNEYEPCIYDVSIIDTKTGITIVEYLDLVEGPAPIRQLSNGKVTYYSHNSSIISFNLNDLFNASTITVLEKAFPVRPSEFVWKADEAHPEDGNWSAVIEEESSGKGYSHQLGHEYIHRFPIRVFRPKPMSILGNVNFGTSNLFEIRQNKEGLDKTGLPKSESLKFINKADGQIYFDIDFELDFYSEKNSPLTRPVKAWNKSGTMFFFSGNARPVFIWQDSRITMNPYGHLLVVVDVKNKDIVKIYKYSHTCHPYWNEEGTEVLFFDTPEEHKECLEDTLAKLHSPKPALASPTPTDIQYSVCAMRDPEHPEFYQVCITDAERQHVFMKLKPYRLATEAALKQSRNIVCFYCTRPGSSDSITIRFDLDDMHTKKRLPLWVWELHNKVDNFVWDDGDARWLPVINGKVIHPAPFYYDDHYFSRVPITLE